MTSSVIVSEISNQGGTGNLKCRNKEAQEMRRPGGIDSDETAARSIWGREYPNMGRNHLVSSDSKVHER